eukprot:TRINITY_DN6364_c0_g1_i1.p1 TRINITY_DN6364_c0_g1~~TRINITY_DN6364_c0_g1_i1.p1  ORF type:complete len:1232 (+),score=333.15 TRINITY_DN6364_c0_g1_i1:196-3891(+)
MDWCWGTSLGLLVRSQNKVLSEEDVPPLRPDVANAQQGKRLAELWRLELEREKPSLIRALRRLCSGTLLGWVLFSVLAGLMSTVGRPVALGLLINYLEDGGSAAQGAGLAMAFSLVLVLEAFCTARSRQLCSEEIGTSWVGATSTLVMTELMHGKHSAAGAPTNAHSLIGNDLMHAAEQAKGVAWLPVALTAFTGGFVVLLLTVGSAAIVGFGVMMTIMVVNKQLSKAATEAEKAVLHSAEARLCILDEILDGIKAVKLFSWEPHYKEQISQARDTECTHVKNYRVRIVSSIVLGRASPVLSGAITIIVYAAMGNTLTSKEVFTSVAVFQAMRIALIMLPISWTALINTLAVFKRVELFLTHTSTPSEHPPTPASPPTDPHTLIKLESASLQWPSAESSTLSNVSLELRSGQVLAVTGEVASGKSSLLNAVVASGVNVKAVCYEKQEGLTIGFATQSPFLISATLKNNILLGRPEDEQWYEHCMRVAQLGPDVKLLQHGDQTLIGERGTALSGGQQARLAIARVLYGRPRLLLLDDPLAAVDPRCAKDLFEQAIMGYVNTDGPPGAAVLVALNQLEFESKCHSVIRLGDGTASVQSVAEEQGIREELSSSRVDVKEDVGVPGDCKEDVDAPEVQVVLSDEGKEEPDREVEFTGHAAEEKGTGAVAAAIYLHYIKSMGWSYVVAVVLLLVLGNSAQGFADVWLMDWTASGDGNGTDEYSQTVRSVVYGCAALTYAVAMLLQSYALALGGVRASSKLHLETIGTLLQAPLSWFEKTPSGRIASRFAADFNKIDMHLSLSLDNGLQIFSSLLVLVGIILFLVPMMAPAVLVAVVLFSALFRATDRANRDLRRISNSAVSAPLTNLKEANSGLLVIKSLGVEDFFMQRHIDTMDDFQAALYQANCVMNAGWFTNNFVSSMISVAAVVYYVINGSSSDTEQAALVLAYSLMVPYYLGMCGYVLMHTTTLLTSLERVLEYSSLEQEPAHHLQGDKPDWLQQGTVEFEDVSLQYRPELPLVLQGVSFSVAHGEKIGICGRTGAGKSSVVNLLLRLVDAQEGGTIRIGGQDIRDMGLHALRSSITVIPQTPLLMAGTVRKCLDPFDKHTDQEITTALHKAGFAPEFAQQTVAKGGSNLSGGQRQLVCFARAALRSSPLLLLDEPTASIDEETDQKLQTMVRESFAQSTILTVAHRLESIAACDKILVMKAGKVAEFGPPEELMSREGEFASMRKVNAQI